MKEFSDGRNGRIKRQQMVPREARNERRKRQPEQQKTTKDNN